MTENMKTVCVGRYLVDVPAGAEVGFSGSMLAGFDVITTEENESVFRERVAAREAELSAPHADAGSDAEGGVESARDLRAPGMIGRTLIYGRSRGYLMEGERRVYLESVSVEVYAHVNGLSVELTAKSTEEASALEAEAILTRLQVRGEEEIPTVPGFCVPHAVFVEPLPAHTNEHIVMHLGLPDHPDISLNLVSIAGARPGPSLLARIAQTDAMTSADVLLRMTKLREGKRSINGVDGEEVLLRAREFNFTTTYGFNWEAGGASNDPAQPLLSLELRTGINGRAGGKPVDTSLHEDALLELWNTIASSIRPRKNGPLPRSSPPPESQGRKLGAMAMAGETCPHSGWWRCAEGGPGMDVHGGQVQYIRKGDRMPQVLLLPRQSLWQKIKRVQPSVESTQPTAWTLIEKRLRPRTSPSAALAPAGTPTSSGAIASTTAHPVAIGTYLRTGESCPASGWWRCEESNALDGTRWFAQGSLFPPATFQVPVGIFAKSAGPEIIRRRSGWQLMRYVLTPTPARVSTPSTDEAQVGDPPALV